MAIVADVPARPDGLELLGETVGSGYRTPPSLVRRQDGQTLQLTPLLYAILDAADGRRGYAEIAQVVAARTGRAITAADVATLVDGQLRPRGLLLGADGTAPELERANPLTGLRFKVAVTDPAVTRRLTEPFTVLFHPLVWLPLLVVFGWVAWWLLMERGLAAATYQAFAKPDLLVVVVAVTILSAGFHEFGHAAAARRGGADPGVMGAGIYLLWPAFYTDVTDTYRLGRAGRIRADLGGLYFNAVVAVAITAIWWASGWDALLLIVAAQILQMVRQLAPLVRFDGYHVLADLTGVPDLFSRIGPILASLWPTRWRDPRVAGLKWWARLVVTAWVIVVVPILVFCLLALVLAAPRVVGTAWESITREWAEIGRHSEAAQYLDAVGAALAIGAVSLPILLIAVVVGRVLFTVVRAVWRRTVGRPVRRAGAAALVATMVGALLLAWWPAPNRYDPIRPFEGGTLLSVASVPLAAAGYGAPAAPSRMGGEVHTVLPEAAPVPTEDDPALALVLVPSGTVASDGRSPADGEAGSGQQTGEPGTNGSAAGPAWVFPFDEPLPPEPGDNQARAVNTTDGSVTYDVAVAMVWVTDDDPVLNVNEAYAFASCSDCVTVAVAFQVVVIVGSADVVVPQNLSAAVNYECFRCITAAVASQLVVTVDALPGVEEQIALADVWADLTEFAATIPTLPLADVIARLEAFKDEVVAILGVAPPAEASPTPVPSGSPDPAPGRSTPSPSAEGSDGPPPSTPSPVLAEPTPTVVPDATPTPTAQPTPAPTASATPSAVPSP